MSFPRYPQYKDSGVEWLGEMPSHWAITRTKHVTEFHTGWTPPTGKAESYEGENLWANISDLGEKWLFDTAKRISDEAIASSRITPSPKGSLLFSFKLSIGQVSFAGKDMYTNEAIATFLPTANIDESYAYYAFPLFLVKNAAENIYGAKLLNQELIRAAILALPDLEEQTAIAIFLDRETAKIDELVGEQEKLIELLKEKRQAVISHAVTKGLNPDAPMKDSGIEWLGEVPQCWEVKPVKAVATCNDEVLEESTPDDYEIKYVEISGVDAGSGIRAIDVIPFSTAPSRARRRVQDGDIIVSTVRTYLRSIATVNNPPNNMVVSTGFAVIRPRRIRPHFLGYLFQAEFLISEVIARSVGVSYPAINASELMLLNVPIPCIEEQTAIANFLDRETAKLDKLTLEAQRGIDLLKERRSALISAAVTGKIDIRRVAA